MTRTAAPFVSTLPAALQDGVDDFVAVLLTERGLSQHTAEAYERDIAQLAEFAATKCARTNWASVSGDDFSRWLDSLAETDVNARTVARKLSAVRTFAKNLVAQGVRRDDFTALAEGPRAKRPLPDSLTERETNALLAAPPMDNPRGLRDRAMLELMYSSGLRVSELCNLSLQSLDVEEGFLRVFGKGGKERVVPVGSAALKAVADYLVAGRPALVRGKTNSALFLSERGTAISRKTFWVNIREAARRAGLARPVKPHLLRHTFATHLLAHDADLRAIQEMLGHADIATTQIYTKVERSHLAIEHARHHPRKNLKTAAQPEKNLQMPVDKPRRTPNIANPFSNENNVSQNSK